MKLFVEETIVLKENIFDFEYDDRKKNVLGKRRLE